MSRKKIILDETLTQYVNHEAWHGIAWVYEDEQPAQPITRYEPLEFITFAREMSLLAEHFNKREMSDPLKKRYFEVLSKKLNKQAFLEAVEAAYSTDLYWAQLIPFLLNHQSQQQKPAAASFALANPAGFLSDLKVDVAGFVAPVSKSADVTAQRSRVRLEAQAEQVKGNA